MAAINAMAGVRDLSPIAATALALIVSYILYLTLTHLRLYTKHAAARARIGAKEPPAVRRIPFLWGLDTLRDNIKTVRELRALSTELGMFHEMGSWTWSTVILGTKFINTTEPDNLKVIMATEFRKWGLGKYRKKVFRPLLGEGEIELICWFETWGLGADHGDF